MAWTTPRTWVTGEIVTAVLLNAQIKDNMDLSAPAKLTTAGDMLYATGANATARLAKGTNGNILHQASCAPAWTATPSITDLTLSGALDVNGTIDYDGTCVDFLSSGDIDIVSSRNAACAIYIAQSTGTSGTIKIHADTGTAVNEGVASIQLLSDVGGIGIKSGLNAAGAIRLTADAGTSETIVLHADQGSGTGSICLTSDAGGITLNPATFVTVGGNATNAGEVRILEDTDNGSNYVALKAPNVSTSYTITLPTAVAASCGLFLKSTCGGVTSWASAGGAVSAINNATANELVTIGATTTELCAESTLTYDGTTLTLGSGQIKFPSTQNGSSNANTLDDYEQGVFCPTLLDDTLCASECQAYNIQVGRYTKVGDRVHINLYIRTTSIGNLSTCNGASIGGLPFPTANVTNGAGGLAVGEGAGLNIASGTNPTVSVIPNVSHVNLRLWDGSDGPTALRIDEWSSNGAIAISGSYEVCVC